jgi:4,5-dihydroxyphthalate decarboxylase
MKRLTAMLGTYQKTTPLKRRSISSPVVEFDFADIDVAQTGFKDVVRNAKYDVAELALMTFLTAYEAGKPYVLLPFVMNGGFHHGSIHCRAGSSLTPHDLAGRRVAMRSYSQTTPAWVRGILADEFGVRQQDVRWLAQEGAHVAEYTDPEWVSRTDDPHGLRELLLSGDVDAIIAGSGVPGGGSVRPLIPHPDEAARDWYAKTNVVPINHMVVIRKEIAESDGDVVREVFRLLCESRAAGESTRARPEIDLQPAGAEKLHGALEMAIRFAYEQRLITKKYAVDELMIPFTTVPHER